MNVPHTSAPAIRVLVIADVRLYRDGLSATLASDRRLTVVGDAGDSMNALAAAARLSPGVVLIDMAMPGALALIRDLRRAAPDAHVIAFALHEIDADIIACAEAGASGFVSPDATIAELIAAIERTVAGELLCSPRIAHQLFRHIAAPAPWPGVSARLTPREAEVHRLLHSGQSNKEIARTLKISVSTAKNHVHHVLAKLEVPSRTQAAARRSPGDRPSP